MTFKTKEVAEQVIADCYPDKNARVKQTKEGFIIVADCPKCGQETDKLLYFYCLACGEYC